MTTDGSPTPLLVLDVVGLTPRLLEHMPNLKALGGTGTHAPLGTVLPAVTCAAQSTFLTGTTPAEHGIVANGWYFRELGDVLLWRQHNGLVAGDKLWDAARRAHPGYTVANICWWYAMGADTDYTVTPRPVYYADGRKEPDCYTRPPALHDELTEKLGTFPSSTSGGRAPTSSPRSGSSTPPGTSSTPATPTSPSATSRTSTTTSSATAPTTRAPSRPRQTSTGPSPRSWRTPAARAAPSSPSPSTGSPGWSGPSTSTAPCAARDSWRSTPRTAWSTWTR